MKIWYWHKENDLEPRGPISQEELKELANNGVLKRSHKVWKEGFDDWVNADSVSNIFSLPPPINTKKIEPPLIGDSNTSKTVSNITPKADKGGTRVPIIPPKKEGDHNHELKGVRGWLSFFCLILIIIGPLVGLGQLVNSWEEISPAFDLYPVLESVMWIETLTIIGIIIYGFFVGVLIWVGNEKGKIIAEKYLKFRLILFIIVGFVILLMVSGDSILRSFMIEEVFISIFAELIFFGVWFTYFKKSRRVANTY